MFAKKYFNITLKENKAFEYVIDIFSLFLDCHQCIVALY